mmetsp:Transcript_2676/g.5443  ORF Transcript_2676/g.5443 Transcript_2676/m.5443 type:complete len:410 (-) Transcript_2676:208-1437(-)
MIRSFRRSLLLSLSLSLSVALAMVLVASNIGVVTGFAATTSTTTLLRNPEKSTRSDLRRGGASFGASLGASLGASPEAFGMAPNTSGAKQRRGARQPGPTPGTRLLASRNPGGVILVSPDYDYPSTVTRIAITVASCYLTWFAQARYSSVMASAALTLLCSMVFDKRLGQAAFCGSFAGMCSRAIIPTKHLALVLGATTALLYEILIHAGNAFVGIGGRLGATAFLATSAVAYKTGVKTGLERLALFGGSRTLELSALQWESTILPFAFLHTVGAVATIVLREISDDRTAADPVRASAVVGLAGALFLREPSAALALYGGSFVGMSLPSKLMSLTSGDLSSRNPTLGNVLSLLLAFCVSGLFAGILHGASVDWNLWQGGWGGKAGVCAFVGCMTYRTMTGLLGALQTKR